MKQKLKGKLDHYWYRFMSILLGIILVWGLFVGQSSSDLLQFIFTSPKKGYFLPVMWLYLLAVIPTGFAFYKVVKTKSPLKICCAIFAITIVPRLILCAFNFYIPTSDFKNYLDYGINFYYGRYDRILDVVSGYGLPEMGGLAVVNGIIAKLFSPQLLGFQIANCIITSTICILIWKIAKFRNETVAAIASFCFAVYPSNIISTQVTTNHHTALLFTLLCVYLCLLALKSYEVKKGYIYILLSGIFLSISNFCHPSTIVLVLAIVFYTMWAVYQFTVCIGWRIGKKMVIYIFVFLFSYYGFSEGGLLLLERAGLADRNERVSMIGQVLVGLNYEFQGKFNADDSALFVSIPRGEQFEQLFPVVIERFRSKNLLKLFMQKTDYLWFSGDSYFTWYRSGFRAQYLQDIENGLLTTRPARLGEQLTYFLNATSQLDMLFIRVVYLFGIMALIFKKRNSPYDVMDFMLFIILGWISTRLLIEVQSRYRYLAMPAFMILAGEGVLCTHIKVCFLLRKLDTFRKRNRNI